MTSNAWVSDSVSQVFISFFYRQPRRKKTVKVSKHTKKTRGPTMLEEVVVDEGSTVVDELEQEMMDEEARGSGDGGDDGSVDPNGSPEIDEAKDAHDKQAVTSVRTTTINAMKARGVLMTDKEEKDALGLFPKVLIPAITRHV